MQDLEKLTINELRKLATQQYDITLTRDMSANDIRLLIGEKGKKSDHARLSEFVGDMPEPGWTRVMVHRDGNPSSSNRPVYVAVNGYRITIPRGIEVDVPTKVVGVLHNAKTMTLKENKNYKNGDPNRFSWEESHSYPFSILATTDGPDPRPGSEVANATKQRAKNAYRDEFGFYPRGDQLRDAISKGAIKGMVTTA